MTKIDFHIILDLHVKPEWRLAALKSVEQYEEFLNIYITDYYPSNFESRKNAFSKGTSEFVSFMDIDDLLTDNIDFRQLLVPFKDPSVVGVYTNSTILDEWNQTANFYAPFIKSWDRKRALTEGYPAHQFMIMRREPVIKFYETINLEEHNIVDAWCDPALHGWICKFGDWHYYPTNNYIWRCHSQGLHKSVSFDTRLPLYDFYNKIYFNQI